MFGGIGDNSCFIPLSAVHRNSAIVSEEDTEYMNKGVHMPTFESAVHGKLRVKGEIGEFSCFAILCLS